VKHPSDEVVALIGEKVPAEQGVCAMALTFST
jgi:hypothetical protein